MKQETTLGRNRTGVQMSPADASDMQQAAEALPADTESAEYGLASLRRPYIEESEGLGSVPLPGTMKGAAKSTVQALKGDKAHVLIDKLGERLAFERSGVRLYESLLSKCEADPDALPEGALERLRHFRDEEAEHFALLADALREIGADPTAQTPCADLVGVEGMGLMQAMGDPRTNLLQSLHVVLDAELLDHAGWELLIQLARAMGQDPMAERFAHALEQEDEHLQEVRRWVEELTLKDASIVRH
jgi:rubrerythrin